MFQHNLDLICNHCNYPVRKHPILEPIGLDSYVECDRDPLESNDFDYWQDKDDEHVVTPYVNYEGNRAGITDLIENARNYEWEDMHEAYVSEAAVMDNIRNTWRDQEPDVCTHATEWHYKGRSGSYNGARVPDGFREDLTNLATDKARSVYVEGEEGYQSVQLIDYHVTALFQQKLLNVYTGRDGILRQGSLRFTRKGDTFTATCYHKSCEYKDAAGNWVKNSLSISVSDDTTREELEEFVANCIRHGNNHGPDWLTTRSDFAFIHAANCDSSKHVIERKANGAPIVTACNSDRQITRVPEMIAPDTLSEALAFLTEHQKYCRTKDCACDYYRKMCDSILWDVEHPLAV